MIYLSGPMTGLPQKNLLGFDAVASEMRVKARNAKLPVPKILSPHDMEQDNEVMSYGGFLKRDLLAMLTICDRVRVIPNWQSSHGACVEVIAALGCGYKVSDGEKFVTKEEAALAYLAVVTKSTPQPANQNA